MHHSALHLVQACWIAIGMLGASSSSATIIISELLYDVSGPDGGQVFVELLGAPGTDLDGLQLEGVNGRDGSVYKHIDLAGLIPADGVFVIGDDEGSGASLVPNTDWVADVDFQNGPDSVVLRDATGILDALGYGDFAAAMFAGEGNPAGDVPAGLSLARHSPWLDTNDNSVDFIAFDVPTPGMIPAKPLPPTGMVPVKPVPEPATAWLLLSGLIGLVGVARCKG